MTKARLHSMKSKSFVVGLRKTTAYSEHKETIRAIKT